MHRRSGLSKDRNSQKALQHRPEKTDWRAKQHANMKKVSAESAVQPFVLQRPLTLKPGGISTILMLSALGNISSGDCSNRSTSTQANRKRN